MVGKLHIIHLSEWNSLVSELQNCYHDSIIVAIYPSNNRSRVNQCKWYIRTVKEVFQSCHNLPSPTQLPFNSNFLNASKPQKCTTKLLWKLWLHSQFYENKMVYIWMQIQRIIRETNKPPVHSISITRKNILSKKT